MKKRYALYDQAEKIVVADAPWVFLYYPVTYIIRQPWVHDYVINPMRPTRFEHVWLSPHPRVGSDNCARLSNYDPKNQNEEPTMITQGDDYPIHQTPEPVQQVFTSDRNFYDRFFFNGYFREGEPYFAVAMGIYPNVGIIDCAFSVVAGGVQHCVRASRVLGAERMDTRVGPISIEIVRADAIDAPSRRS